jgi:iron complex transport system ATP-binding protein
MHSSEFALLQADNVSFSYERSRSPTRWVIRELSLAVRPGTIVGVIGPNGAGKTTLLRLLSGTLSASSGRVSIEGRDIARLSRRDIARRIAVVPQETRSTFDFSVLDIVLMGRYPHLATFELEDAGDLAIAREALAAVGAAHLDARPFESLSGGEKQRVVIAGALAQASDVLLLDEPTASLDLASQLEIASLMRRLNEERGTTMVVSTHDLNLAAAVCSELALLAAGQLVARGETRRVLSASNIRALYGVDADVQYHTRAGHLTVVPIGRTR